MCSFSQGGAQLCTHVVPSCTSLCARCDRHITANVGPKRNCTRRRLETLIILIMRRIHTVAWPQSQKHTSRILVNFCAPCRHGVCCAREVPELFARGRYLIYSPHCTVGGINRFLPVLWRRSEGISMRGMEGSNLEAKREREARSIRDSGTLHWIYNYK